MFKLFRKYNKVILVWGGCLLMVAFLVPQSLTQCSGGGGDYTIGTTDTGKVTEFERRNAAYQLEILQRLPLVGQMAGALAGQDDPALKWLLMTRDAQRLGLSAGPSEVNTILAVLGVDEAGLATMAGNMRTTPDTIRATIAAWLTLDRYDQLISGNSYAPLLDRINALGTATQFMQQGNYQAAFMTANAIEGGGRLSAPLIAHFLQEQGATVSGEAVLIGAGRYLDRVGEPTEAELQKLFDDHQSKLPGFEPYGFGYRTPDRVKIEYLVISIDRAQARVQVDEAEAYEYYEQNKAALRPDPTTGETPPYSAVRGAIIDALKQQKAAALADRMAKSALAQMFEAQRGLEEKSGYKVLPEDFKPIDLQRIADDLDLEYQVEPQVFNETDHWTAVTALEQLPGLQYAMMQRRPQVSMTQYIMSAKQMEPASDNALVTERLQVGLPGSPLIGADRSRILFRLTAAEPAHDAADLEAVREQVVQDARMLAAYHKLLDDRETWESKAEESGLTGVASEVGASLVVIPSVARRVPVAGGMSVPPIRDIGTSEQLVREMFEHAIAADASEGGLAEATAASRIGAAGVDERLSLAVFEVDGYRPITRGQYTRALRDTGLAWMIDVSLFSGEDDPLSFDAVAKRVNWTPEAFGEPVAEQAPAEDDTEA